jgi:hypothetical protein
MRPNPGHCFEFHPSEEKPSEAYLCMPYPPGFGRNLLDLTWNCPVAGHAVQYSVQHGLQERIKGGNFQGSWIG